jgi:starvation-inducible outer membrane lipoprotein
MFRSLSRSASFLFKRPETHVGALFLSLSLVLGACGTRPPQSTSQVHDMGCKRYETVHQCVNKTLCNAVCSTAGSTGGQVICNQVCELVPECSDLPVCVEPWPGE